MSLRFEGVHESFPFRVRKARHCLSCLRPFARDAARLATTFRLHSAWLSARSTGAHLVLLALLLLGTNLLVVLLEGGEVLASLGELALLHTLADVPVDEGALGVHEVELVVDAREKLGDGSGVG